MYAEIIPNEYIPIFYSRLDPFTYHFPPLLNNLTFRGANYHNFVIGLLVCSIYGPKWLLMDVPGGNSLIQGRDFSIVEMTIEEAQMESRDFEYENGD